MHNYFGIIIILLDSFLLKAEAQNVQYVTISVNQNDTNYQSDPQYLFRYYNYKSISTLTNQIISLVGYDYNTRPGIVGRSFDGNSIVISPVFLTSGYSFTPSQLPQFFTGFTNITVYGNNIYGSAATFQITTPGTTTVISNYVPADAIVIPASTTGNVQIILESSPDLVNWNAANPGTYGASAGTNRFFRVRATAN